MHQPGPTGTTTVARELVQALRDLGVRHVFGVPSGGWIDYMDALRATRAKEWLQRLEMRSAA